MTASVSCHIFAYRIGLPLSSTMTSRVQLRLINSSGLLELNNENGQGLTRYRLAVKDVSYIGLSSFDESKIDQRFRDLVLSTNLTLRNVALTTKGTIFSEITVEGAGTITETIRVVAGIEQELDEPTVMARLALANKADRHCHVQPWEGKRHNLIRALSEYEKAFDTIDAEAQFKHLFNAVENAVNWDKDRTSMNFDKEASSISNVAESSITNWRQTYDRLKHPDTTMSHVQSYGKIKSNIAGELFPLRDLTNNILTKRLAQL